MPRSKPGKSLETLVSSIERVLAGNDNVSVESPKFLSDRITGESREHDVVITLTGSHHKSTIAIECRDRSRKVTVNEIESFWSKCQDTGIDRGIIVSSKGFTKAALTKSLHRGIRCLRLSEASSFNWLLTTGIRIRHRKMDSRKLELFYEFRSLSNSLNDVRDFDKRDDGVPSISKLLRDIVFE